MTHVDPSFDNNHFRYGNDGTQSGHTFIYNLDTNGDLDVDTTYLMRISILETAGGSVNNVSYQWEYNRNSLGWNSVTTSSNVIQAVNSANLTDAADCTQRISSGTFITDNDGVTEDGLAGGAADYVGNDVTETLLAFQIVGADVADNDTIQLRATVVGQTNAYTSIPSISVNKAVHTPLQGVWRWYSDATPDTSMTALANENTAPTLTQSQMQNGIVRLRVQIVETGGAAGTGNAIELQYSEDNSNWRDIADQSVASGDEGVWIRWANGAATVGGTLSNQLLTGTDASGLYHEVADATENVPANATHEIDLALQMRWPPPDVTIRFRLSYGGATLGLDGGATQIQLITSNAATRGNAVGYMAQRSDGTRSLELRFGAWPRFFHDGTRWWFFTVQPDDDTNISYYYSDTNGDNWSARQTISMTGSMDGTLHCVAFKIISGTPVVFIVNRSSSSTRRWRRGEISGTTITWDAEGSAAIASERYAVCDIDDGNFWWIAGIDATGPGVWACRATNADTGTSWSSGFGTRHTVANSGATSGDPIRVVGLASDKAIVIWYNGSDNNMYWSLVDDTSGFGSVNTLHVDAHEDDWGVARSNGFVYVILADGISDDGTRKLYVFDESTETFSAAADPGDGGIGDTGSADGLPLVAVGDDVYFFGIYQEAEGGQSRSIEYRKYAGPDDSGTWDSSRTVVTPSGSRGNFDHATASLGAGGGAIIVGSLFGDDNLLFSGQAIEYYQVAATVTLTVNLGFISGTTSVYALAPELTIAPAFISSNTQVYAIATPDIITIGFIASLSILYNPTLESSIALNFLNSATALFTPQLNLNTLLGFIASISSLFSPTIEQTIYLNAISSSTTVYALIPESGVTPALINSSTTVYALTASAGLEVTLGFISSTSTIHALAPELTVALGFISSVTSAHNLLAESTIALGFISSTGVLYTPTIETTVALGAIASNTTVYSLSASAGITVTLGFIPSVTNLYAPALELTVALGFVASTTTIYAPSVAADSGAQGINLAFLANASVLYNPFIESTIEIGFINTDTTLYNPAISIDVPIGFIASTSLLYPPTIHQTLLLDFTTTGTVLYTPQVQAQILIPVGQYYIIVSDDRYAILLATANNAIALDIDSNAIAVQDERYAIVLQDDDNE